MSMDLRERRKKQQEGYRRNLRSGRLSLGSWITIADSSVAEILANAGFEWLVVDVEHTGISVSEAVQLIRTIDLCGAVPFVRLTSNDENQIKRFLDGGAQGIVVPMVNSADDAARAVAATRYRPTGRRGVGLARAQGFGVSFKEYLEWQRSELIVIAQIEHQDAITALDEILLTPGIDGFLVGPYDLSCSLGVPGRFNEKVYQEALARILDAGRRHNKPAGIHIVEPDLIALKAAIKSEYRMIAYSVDFRMLDTSARTGIHSIKGFDV